MKLAQIPNILTIIRIIMVAPIIITLIKADYFTTLILFFIAGLTDMLDGFIAKKFKFQSYLGSIIDPMADKILLVSIFFTMFLTNLIPLWFFIIVLVRDVMIVAGVVGYFLNTTSKEGLNPSNISKINTFMQIFLVLFIVLTKEYPALDVFTIELIIITATTTILSGADYVWLWLREFILKTKK
jgi:cardiolipin synthase